MENSKRVSIDFVLIPAGEFQMGSNKYDDETPAHTVSIKNPFHMGRYPVTQKQYRAIMGYNPASFKGENHPVETVSWNDAQEFIKKLNDLETKSIPTGKKYRLPSEAEWEYACRANNKTDWCFGDDESDLKNYAWYHENSDSKTHEVGQKKPNEFDLFDMHGNVWEWTCSDYGKYSQNRHLECSVNKAARKTMRGGCWRNFAENCRSSYREDIMPDYRDDSIGFRLV